MSKPNVLLLCSDEHARRYAGCFGSSFVHSPVLDRLAKRATVFNNAYTPSPICIPARASLATGRQVHETGCWSSAQAYDGQTESWMHRARDHGYTVMSFGKLHFRSADDDNGFTEEVLPMYLANDGAGWPHSLLRDPLPDYPATSELARHTGCGESEYTEYDRKITDATCNWLRKYSTQPGANPWVLFVSFVSPHYPLTAPEPFYQLYQHTDCRRDPLSVAHSSGVQHPVLNEVRRFFNYDDYFTDDLRLEARKNYFGLVSFLDHNIGKVLQTLDDCGTMNDTVILYVSDHGEMLGHLGFWTKSVMYEDSAGIPLLAAGRGFKPKQCSAPVSLTNIGNTILESIGAKHPAPATCLEESLQSITANPDVPRFTLSQYHDGGTPVGFFMLREQDWKLVHYCGGYRPQLFNLKEDPWELNDLAEQPRYASQLQQLQNKLFATVDLDTVIADYTRDQAERIAEFGGRDAIVALADFGHTPVQ